MLPIAFAAMAAFQLASGYQQSQMIREQNRLRKKIMDMNTEAAELDAWEAEQFGYTQQARYQSVVDSTLADQKLAFTSANVDVTYGTAADVLAETKTTGLLNQLEIERQARERANGFRREARNNQVGSSMGDLQAELDAGSARASGAMGAASTLISGYGRNN